MDLLEKTIVELIDKKSNVLESRIQELEEKLKDQSDFQNAEYYTVKEVAKIFRCTEQHIFNMMSRRKISYTKIGKKTLIHRDAVKAFAKHSPATS